MCGAPLRMKQGRPRARVPAPTEVPVVADPEAAQEEPQMLLRPRDANGTGDCGRWRGVGGFRAF